MEARAKERQCYVGRFYKQQDNYIVVRSIDKNGDLIGTSINIYDEKCTIVINNDLGNPDESWNEISEIQWREVVARAFNMVP